MVSCFEYCIVCSIAGVVDEFACVVVVVDNLEVFFLLLPGTCVDCNCVDTMELSFRAEEGGRREVVFTKFKGGGVIVGELLINGIVTIVVTLFVFDVSNNGGPLVFLRVWG